MSAAEFLKKYQKKPVVQSNNNNTTTTAAAVVLSPSATVEPTLSSLVTQFTLLGTYNKTLLTINKTPTSAPLKVDFSMGIGCDCASAAALRFAKLRPCSLPLDWIRSTPESTRRMLMLHEEYPIDATTTTNPSTLIEEEVVESKISSLGARRRYFKAFHPRGLYNATTANITNHNKEEDEESIVGRDDEGPDPLMAPCDSDADDDAGVSIVSKMAHKVAASSSSSSTDASGISWTLSCPLFEGLEAAVKVARLRNTLRGVEVSVACDTLPVYHRLDTQQYFTAPIDNSGTTTPAAATNSNIIPTPSGLKEPHHEAFFFDRNFGLIASREEAMNAQRRMVRVHWALREIRKQINEQQVDEPHPSNQQQPVRILLLCTGRVVGDCPEITARINGGHLVTSPFKSKAGSENTQLCQEALSVAEAVLTIVSPPITSDNMKTSSQQRRPLDVHLVLVNVGMDEESIRLDNCVTASVVDGRQKYHQPTATVHIHKRFVGYPSAAKPWANVGALTSEVLTDMYRL